MKYLLVHLYRTAGLHEGRVDLGCGVRVGVPCLGRIEVDRKKSGYYDFKCKALPVGGAFRF